MPCHGQPGDNSIGPSLAAISGPSHGPVFEVTVKSVEEAKARLVANGCQVIKDEPDFPRCYIMDGYGVAYNLLEGT